MTTAEHLTKWQSDDPSEMATVKDWESWSQVFPSDPEGVPMVVVAGVHWPEDRTRQPRVGLLKMAVVNGELTVQQMKSVLVDAHTATELTRIVREAIALKGE